MPLTAVLDDTIPLDSTRIGPADWDGLHDVRPRRDLRCRECGARMHAKTSSAGLRFFAHDRQASGCPSVGETAEHRELKQMLAELIRSLGCTAAIEATPAPDDTGGWRADVLGTSRDGTRVAFEVQLAAMTREEGQRRTERYAVDGIGCLWVSPRNAPWMTGIPSCHIVPDDDGYVADRGLARFRGGGWEPAGTVGLHKVVLGLLTNRIVAVKSDYFSEATSGRTFWTSRACVLVSTQDSARCEEQNERIRRERQDEERRSEAHRANRQALEKRQERVLQHALRALLATGVEPSQVRLGIPSEPWAGTFPTPLRLAVGNEKSAQAAVIWVVRDGHTDLWAVICPVASLAGPGLGDSWRLRNVQVFVETDREASRVSQAIGWPRSAIRVAAGP